MELPIISFNISGLNYRLVKETIKLYNENKIPENFYYGIILNYYRNVKNRTVKIEGILEEDVFFGKDSRSFYKLMTENRLPNIYKRISEESVEGFNKIQVNNKTEEQCMLNILRFLNICCPVIIKR